MLELFSDFGGFWEGMSIEAFWVNRNRQSSVDSSVVLITVFVVIKVFWKRCLKKMMKI